MARGVVPNLDGEFARTLIVGYRKDRVTVLDPVEGTIHAVASNDVVEQVLPREESRCGLFEMILEGVVMELHQLLRYVGPHVVVAVMQMNG